MSCFFCWSARGDAAQQVTIVFAVVVFCERVFLGEKTHDERGIFLWWSVKEVGILLDADARLGEQKGRQFLLYICACVTEVVVVPIPRC